MWRTNLVDSGIPGKDFKVDNIADPFKAWILTFRTDTDWWHEAFLNGWLFAAAFFLVGIYWVAHKREPSKRAKRDEVLRGEIGRVHAENLSVYGADNQADSEANE